MLDRFNVAELAREHGRSMINYKTGRSDRLAKIILRGLPIVAAGLVVWQHYRLPNPQAILPAVGLLAGVFFAAVGQLFSIRGRIADSVQLSGNRRLRAHFRESISGMLLAALAALVSALLLGFLAQLPAAVATPKTKTEHFIDWSGVGSTALLALLLTFMVLLFISSARRLYTSYLEAFERGLPLEKSTKSAKPVTSDDTTGPSAAPASVAEPMPPLKSTRSGQR